MKTASFIPISLGLMVRQISATGFQVWMQRRREKGPLEGLWEFPGGKWHDRELPRKACAREVYEETGVGMEADSWVLLKIYPFSYFDRSVVLHAYLNMEQKSVGENLELPESSRQKWFSISFEHPLQDLKGEIPAANEKILKDLAHYLKEGEGPCHW